MEELHQYGTVHRMRRSQEVLGIVAVSEKGQADEALRVSHERERSRTGAVGDSRSTGSRKAFQITSSGRSRVSVRFLVPLTYFLNLPSPQNEIGYRLYHIELCVSDSLCRGNTHERCRSNPDQPGPDVVSQVDPEIPKPQRLVDQAKSRITNDPLQRPDWTAPGVPCRPMLRSGSQDRAAR
jgi:hypothetical protein